MAGSAGDRKADQERWTAIAEGLYSPAVAAIGERGLLLFALGSTGELSVRKHDGEEWGPALSLGAPGIRIDGAISACSAGAGAAHLFARGLDGELAHGLFRDGGWGGFEAIGVPSAAGVPMGLATVPSVCSRAPGALDLFGVNIAGDLLQASWDESGFTPFEPLGPAPGAVAAAACGSRAMALLSRDAAGGLCVKWWNGERWGAFSPLGAPEEDDLFYPGNPRTIPLSGTPVACGGGSARLDVFARGAGGDLFHRSWNGTAWSPFVSLGIPPEAPFLGTSLACAWRKFRLDVFARAADGKLYTRTAK